MNIINYIKGLFKTEEKNLKQEIKVEHKQKGIELYKTNKYKRDTLEKSKKACNRKVKELSLNVSVDKIRVKEYFDRKNNDELCGYRIFDDVNYNSYIYFTPKKESNEK